MIAVCTTIAQAVTDQLNGHSFSEPFTAVRGYIPNYDLATNPGLHVFVSALQQVIDLDNGSREYSVDTYTVNVAIYQQVDRNSGGQPDTDEVDALVYLVQQIADYAKANPQPVLDDNTTLVAIRNAPVYDPSQLDSNNTFVSVLAFDYRLLR